MKIPRCRMEGRFGKKKKVNYPKIQNIENGVFGG